MNTKQKQNEISFSTLVGIHSVLRKTIMELNSMEIAEYRKNGSSADHDEIVKHWQIIMELKEPLMAAAYVPIAK
tara:strand:- start:285 stop:506 length:222 start_codon:yes stop_codon:yes gene_type:complete